MRGLYRQMNVDAHFWGERDSVQLRADLVDCEVAICAPEVLMLFSDNFDYQVGCCAPLPSLPAGEREVLTRSRLAERQARLHPRRSERGGARQQAARARASAGVRGPRPQSARLRRDQPRRSAALGLPLCAGHQPVRRLALHLDLRIPQAERLQARRFALAGSVSPMNLGEARQLACRCREQGVSVARDAAVLRDTVIGSGTHIQSSAVVRGHFWA